MTAVSSLHGYHVHIYYNSDTRPIAEKLSEALAANFPVETGRFASGPAGPHPAAQTQVIFQKEAFQSIVPWLMFNRQGLDILVHPLSDDQYDDHTNYALWLGTPVNLKLDVLPHGPYSADRLPSA